MAIPLWAAKLAGKFLAKKLDLKEGTVEDSKKWYQSKAVLAGLATALFGTYELVKTNVAPNFGWTLPDIPSWVFTLLGAMGIWGRVTAEKKIG